MPETTEAPRLNRDLRWYRCDACMYEFAGDDKSVCPACEIRVKLESRLCPNCDHPLAARHCHNCEGCTCAAELDAAVEQARREVWEKAIGVVKKMEDDYLATATALNTDGLDPFTHNVGVAMEIIEQLEAAAKE